MLQHGRYDVIACTVTFFRPDGEKKKVDKVTGKLVPVLVPSRFRYIWFKTGALAWCFTGTKHGAKWSDSRDKTEDMGAKPKPFTEATLRQELARMTSDEFAAAVLAEVEGNQIKGDEYATLIGAYHVDVPMTDGTSKYTRVGGLPDQVVAMTAALKERRELDKRVNKR